MSITSDIQQLEPGALIELFEVDCTAIGGDMLRFHGHLQSTSIWWQGNEYKPWPIQATGFEHTSDAQQPSPTLSVGNVNGTISALCVYLADMVGAKVRRHRTLTKYLDAVNFPTEQIAVSQLFCTGDGATNTFQLKAADGSAVVQDVTVDSIYRNDWQGNQQLYPTPRTNVWPQSSGKAVWGSAASLTATLGATNGPAGSATAMMLVESATNAVHAITSLPGFAGITIPANSNLTFSVFVCPLPGGTHRYINLLLSNSANLNATYCRVTFDTLSGSIGSPTFGTTPVTFVNATNDAIPGSSWRRISLTCSMGATTIPNTYLYIANALGPGVTGLTYVGDGASGFLVDGRQYEVNAPGDRPTSLIATSGSARTVTDYTVSPAGLVTLGETPVQSAALTWNGTGESISNPSADPTQEMAPELWYIEQKSSETNVQVDFMLSSALDFGGQQLPARQIVPICQWQYRDANCGYAGTAYFDANDNSVSDPALDRCSKKTSGCECRFGVNNPLPFGGFLSDVLS